MSFGAPAIGSLATPLLNSPIGGGNTGISTGSTIGGGSGPVDKAGNGFSSVLKDKLSELTNSQAGADKASEDMATGRAGDVAQAMLKVEQASVTMQVATQVRNKVIEAYQDVLRMPM